MLIRVVAMPWLSELLNGSIARKAEMEETAADGESLRGLLLRLHESHARFGRMVFDSETDQLTGHAEIAINGSLYDQTGGLDTPLHDGDTVTFLPSISGGGDGVPYRRSPVTEG